MLTPITNRDPWLNQHPNLADKEAINERRIKKALILFAPPKPTLQSPHHHYHPISPLRMNVGFTQKLDMGRWMQEVSFLHVFWVNTTNIATQCDPPGPRCPSHNVTEPLSFEILLNSEPLATWILIREEIRFARDFIRWRTKFKNCVRSIPNCTSVLPPITNSLKRKASALNDTCTNSVLSGLMMSAPSRKTARMSTGGQPPRR